MFFESDDIAFHLLDVLELEQEKVDMQNSGRSFSALSYRIRSDAILSTATDEHPLSDGCIAFVPARLDYRRTSSMDHLIVIHFELLNHHADKIEILRPESAEIPKALFDKILTIWETKEIGYKQAAAAALYEILGECYRQSSQKGEPVSKIARSVEYIDRHYTDPHLSIADVAGAAFMSEVYLRRLFKVEFGITPQQYIVRQRILHAAGLISSGYHTLKEIAYLSGYTDYKYFSVEFKRLMGVSPSKYEYHYPR